MSVVSFTPVRPCTLSTTDLDTVKSASDRDDIGGRLSQLWDRLVDFICSTNRVEAKKCLFDMLSPLTTDLKKIESFEKLGQFLGEGFGGMHETHTDHAGNEFYNLYLPGSTQACFSLHRTNYPCDRAAIQNDVNDDRKTDDSSALTRDIDRGDYYIGDTCLEGSAKERLQTWDNCLNDLACTDAQKAALTSICTQKTFGSILCHVKTVQPTDEQQPPLCFEQMNSILEYRLDASHDNTMVVQGRCVLDIAAEGNPGRLSQLLTLARTTPSAQNSTDTMFQISVNQAGEATLLDVRLLCRREVPQDTAA